MTERPPPAHATICSPSVTIVENILSLYPVGYYLLWRSELEPSTIMIVLRAPGTDKYGLRPNFIRVPLCSSVEAELSAVGYPRAICASPPPPRTLPAWTVKSLRPDGAAPASDERALSILSLPTDIWKKIIGFIRDVKTLCALRRVSVVQIPCLIASCVRLPFGSADLRRLFVITCFAPLCLLISARPGASVRQRSSPPPFRP